MSRTAALTYGAALDTSAEAMLADIVKASGKRSTSCEDLVANKEESSVVVLLKLVHDSREGS